ncbi:unnamed protein product [Taenia asiatica]|uniref:Dolichyl-P-Glc:Glc(2)Man(9)GlcNAc(2)-PP-dolichol alpha-1,2-glucosyltransferase n=1 Tax=Taenia asiatica TaxID=60517 RepID=A0A0R3WDC8_TAEAS|nr:unnamed protein product [Taenia asiatica]
MATYVRGEWNECAPIFALFWHPTTFLQILFAQQQPKYTRPPILYLFFSRISSLDFISYFIVFMLPLIVAGFHGFLKVPTYLHQRSVSRASITRGPEGSNLLVYHPPQEHDATCDNFVSAQNAIRAINGQVARRKRLRVQTKRSKGITFSSCRS